MPDELTPSRLEAIEELTHYHPERGGGLLSSPDDDDLSGVNPNRSVSEDRREAIIELIAERERLLARIKELERFIETGLDDEE